MKNLQSVFIVLVTAVTLGGCSEPLWMMPGGELSGEVRTAPLEWMGVPDTIQVETNPEDPYSINIWGVDIGNKLYVSTSAEGTTWSAFIDKDSRVRVRVDGNLYQLTATKIEDPVERADVLDLYVQKYDQDPEDSFVADGLIYRFE